MHLTGRRVLQLIAGIVAMTAPAYCICAAPTPEPATFWMMGAGAGAVLLFRRFRSKKK